MPKMTLYWSRRSPFARKALMVAHEAGVADQIELVRIDIPMKQPHPALQAANPLSKLPTLVTEEGVTIIDSPVIAEYLDIRGRGDLFPAAGPERWSALYLQALADEILTLLLLWRAELRRPAETQSAAQMAACAAKLDAVLSRLEQEASRMSSDRLTIGEVTVGIMLSYLDFRFYDRPWRAAHPTLARWQASFDARPAAIASAFHDD